MVALHGFAVVQPVPVDQGAVRVEQADAHAAAARHRLPAGLDVDLQVVASDHRRLGDDDAGRLAGLPVAVRQRHPAVQADLRRADHARMDRPLVGPPRRAGIEVEQQLVVHDDRLVVQGHAAGAVVRSLRPVVQERPVRGDAPPRLAVAVADQLADAGRKGAVLDVQEAQVHVAVVERGQAVPLPQAAEGAFGVVQEQRFDRRPGAQVGGGGQADVAPVPVAGFRVPVGGRAHVDHPARVAVVADHLEVVAVGGLDEFRRAREVDAVGALPQVEPAGPARQLDLLVGDVAVVLVRVGARPHAVVVHEGDHRVALGRRSVVVADHGVAVHGVDVAGRQIVGELEVEVVARAAAPLDQPQLRLLPVDAVAALRVGVGHLPVGVVIELIPEPQAAVLLADHRAPRDDPAAELPLGVTLHHRLRREGRPVEHAAQVDDLVDAVVVDEQVQVGVVHDPGSLARAA